jgi:hypothetical protein
MDLMRPFRFLHEQWSRFWQIDAVDRAREWLRQGPNWF